MRGSSNSSRQAINYSKTSSQAAVLSQPVDSISFNTQNAPKTPPWGSNAFLWASKPSSCFVVVIAEGFAALLRSRQELPVHAGVDTRGKCGSLLEAHLCLPLAPLLSPTVSSRARIDSPRRRSARIRILAAAVSRGFCGPSDEQPADDSEGKPHGDNRMTTHNNEGQKYGDRRGKGENRQHSEPPPPQIHAKVPNGRWDWTMKFV